MNDAPGDLFASFLPILFIWGVTAAIFLYVAKRKGTATWSAVVGSFPLWAYFFAIILASKTDKDVIDRLEKLEKVTAFD